MRHLSTCLAALLLVGCKISNSTDGTDGTGSSSSDGSGGSGSGGDTSASSTGSQGSTSAATGGGGNSVDLPKDDNFEEDSTPDDTLPMTVTAPTQLIMEESALVAITSDDRLVYSNPQGLFTMKAVPGAPAHKAASIVGNAYARGRTVFNFANVDYTAGTGALTFWTPKHGRRFAGTAMIGEAGIAARNDDEQILFLEKDTEATVNIVVSSADAEKAFRLIEGAGRGNMETCAPNIGFAGDAAIVTWCVPGSTQATLSRFTLNPQGAWVQQDITTSAQGSWSSDATGKKLFYVTTQVEGIVRDTVTNDEKKVGSGVGSGRLTKAGDAVYFTVGDQLRRSDMNGSAIPIVVDGFQQAVAWSADFSKVLYSSEVIYEDISKQDLRWSETAYFNPSPTTIVPDPVATLGRSPMTDDAGFALFLTAVGPQGGTLHIQPMGAGAAATLNGIDSVVAGKASTIVITDNRTAPAVFPPLVDLKVFNAQLGGAPTLLETGILDGRDILVRSDKSVVIYRRTGVDGGVWVRPL